jgi:hypothetical protein
VAVDAEGAKPDDLGGGTGVAMDPRQLLSIWANASDEWVRLLVAEIIATGRPLGDPMLDSAYSLFRQEKVLDERVLEPVEKLGTEARQDETAPPFAVDQLSEVRGVNALVPGSVIEPHEGLTILYGENGTGKTGYSRIFKALANSRTADEILGNIASEADEALGAKIEYTVDGATQVLEWVGDRGIPPFTRMSIFDAPRGRWTSRHACDPGGCPVRDPRVGRPGQPRQWRYDGSCDTSVGYFLPGRTGWWLVQPGFVALGEVFAAGQQGRSTISVLGHCMSPPCG